MTRIAVQRVLMLAFAVPAFAGCDASDGSGGPDAVAPVTSELKLVVKEWAIEADRASVQSGTVRFVVQNTGHDLHEVVILRSDLTVEQLPKDEQGGVLEEAEGVEFIGEIEDVLPGDSLAADFQLEPGRYVLVCNIAETEEDGHIEHHFVEGMVTTVQVD